MNIGIYQAASGMRSNMERQTLIAGNLSRQGIPGSRQITGGFEVPVDTSIKNIKKGEAVPQIISEHVPIKTQTRIDFTQGAMEQTGNPLNFAIMGRGLFSVRDTKGDISYTRNGAFSRATDGRVVTTDGAELLLEGGTALNVPSTAKVTLSPNGSVQIDGTDAGKLGIVNVEDPGSMLKELGNGRFVASNPDQVLQGMAAGDQVSQNQLEQSNTDPIGATVSMIQVMRLYEANQKALAAQDDASGRLIRTISERV